MTEQQATERAAMLHALRAFILSRPGLEPGNYASARDYRKESAEITRDRDDALTLWQYVAAFASDLTSDYLTQSGRLTWDRARGQWYYCAGQYYPVEYRRAAARLLAGALWNYWRDSLSVGGRVTVERERIERIARNAFRSRRVRKYFN